MSLLTRVVDWFYEPQPEPAPQLPAGGEAVLVDKAEAGPTERAGVAGYSHYGGWLGTTEKHADMIGASRWKNFDDWKRNIPPVGLGIRMYLTLGGLPTWSVVPYKADDAEEATPEDIERAQWLGKQVRSMETQWADAVMTAMLSTLDGFTLQAWMFKRLADGRFGLADLEHRPPHTIERWTHDENGKVIGVVQRAPNDGAEIPISMDRLVWTKDLPLTDHPEGVGVLRQLAECVRQMQELLKYQNKGFEKDVNGIPIVYGPIMEKRGLINQQKNGRTYTQADFDAEFRDVLRFVDANVRKGAGLALDSSTYPDTAQSPTPVRRWHAEVLHAQASSFQALEARIDRLVWQILALIGFEYLLLGQDGGGSLAMHASKMQGAIRVVRSVLNRIAETFRRQLVMPLWKWNGWDPETAPTLAWAELALKDVSNVAATLGDLLTKAGIEPGRADHIVNEVLSEQGLSELKPYDDADLVLRREEAREAAAEAAGLGDGGEPEDEPEEE
jgi:hypothetical protein